MMQACKLTSMLLLSMTLLACGGIARDQIVKHPDAPVQILETSGKYIRVAVYDLESNSMIEYGWVKIDAQLVGWTISKVDWAKLIESRRSVGNRNP